MCCYIKLEERSILHVPIEHYERDFKFVINQQTFQTSRLFADLISPKISRYHLIDSTIDEYVINTKLQGNFEHIMNIQKFNEEKIDDDELEFIIEIMNDLEIKREDITIRISDETTEKSNTSSSTITQVIQNLSKRQSYRYFYAKEIEEDLEFISQHFYEMTEEDRLVIQSLEYSFIDNVLKSEKLTLENEDELVKMINELYLKDNKFSELYSYVDFKNVTREGMKEYLSIISFCDITFETWKPLSERLSCEIINENDQSGNENENERSIHRYMNQKSQKMKNQRKPIQTIFYSNHAFEGIIKYLSQRTSIKDEINVSSSSKGCDTDIWTIFNYDGAKRQFWTCSEENSCICIEFKNHEIKPSHYSIRAGYDKYNPRSFVLEGRLNEESEWTIINEQKEKKFFKNELSYRTFTIEKDKQQLFKYFRLRLTGNNFSGSYELQINSIEIFGEIF